LEGSRTPLKIKIKQISNQINKLKAFITAVSYDLIRLCKDCFGSLPLNSTWSSLKGLLTTGKNGFIFELEFEEIYR
jgi:hypothetical protein